MAGDRAASTDTRQRREFQRLSQAVDAGIGGSRLLFASTEDSDPIENTTDQTGFDIQFSIPGGTLKKGTVLDVLGLFKFSDTGTPTLRLKLRVPGITLCDLGVVTLDNTVTNKQIAVLIEIVCRSEGQNGKIQVNLLDARFNATPIGQKATLVFPFNTEADQVIRFTAAWSAASTSNTILQELLRVIHVGDSA